VRSADAPTPARACHEPAGAHCTPQWHLFGLGRALKTVGTALLRPRRNVRTGDQRAKGIAPGWFHFLLLRYCSSKEGRLAATDTFPNCVREMTSSFLCFPCSQTPRPNWLQTASHRIKRPKLLAAEKDKSKRSLTRHTSRESSAFRQLLCQSRILIQKSPHQGLQGMLWHCNLLGPADRSRTVPSAVLA